MAKVLSTPILTSGAVGRSVEAQLCGFFNTGYAGLTNSWTNGALAALLALGVGPGDEVIVPAMTFIASANVVELVGAKAVFVDVEPDTLLLSIDAVVKALTPATKAVMPVHLYGQMVDIPALKTALGEQSGIAIIEDAAHCFEGTFAGDQPGRHSDIALFSFYATKNITCGEGGAFITNSEKLYEKLLLHRLHGMSAGAADRYKQGQYRHWDMEVLGVKANLPDLLAALLPAQIDTVRDRLVEREEISARYEAGLAGTGIRLARVRQTAVSARHLFPIHVPTEVRDQALAALNRSGIGATVNYRSVPTLTYYRAKYGYGPDDFPVSFDWGEGTISLPLYPGLSESDQQFVIDLLGQHVVPMIESHLT